MIINYFINYNLDITIFGFKIFGRIASLGLVEDWTKYSCSRWELRFMSYSSHADEHTKNENPVM